MPKISDLPAAASLSGTDEAGFNQSGTTRRGNVSQFAAGMQADIDHTQIQNIGVNGHPAIDIHIADLSNPHVVTKTQVGLGNVENIKVNLVATVPPTVNNDNTEGYSILSRWADLTNDNEYVCIDASTGTAIWIATTSVAKGNLLVTPGSNNSSSRSPYATTSVGSSASGLFSFMVPADFTSNSECLVFCIPGGTGAALDIDLIVNFGAVGEQYNANSASDLVSTYSLTVGQVFSFDITPILSGLAAGDTVGVEMDHNTIGQTVYYTILKFEYNRF